MTTPLVHYRFFAKKLTFKQRISLFWVTMGGAGLSPYGPGTMGAVLGAGLFYWALSLTTAAHLVIIVVATLLAVVAISHLQKQNDQFKDASWMVIDEGVGIWISLLGWDGSIEWLVAAFILFRLLDIFKPFPVSYFDKKSHGPWSVMLDDIAAGALTWAFLYMVQALRVLL